jgi:hypothetical protein
MSIRLSGLRVLTCVLMFLLAVRLACESVGGSISGLVTDPSGAVMEGRSIGSQSG